MSVLLLGLVFAPSSVFQQLFSALGLSAGVARDTAAGLDTEGGAEVNSENTGTGDGDAGLEDTSVNVRLDIYRACKAWKAEVPHTSKFQVGGTSAFQAWLPAKLKSPHFKHKSGGFTVARPSCKCVVIGYQ